MSKGRSGYAILKEKVAKLEIENEALRKEVETKSYTTTKLTSEYLAATEALEKANVLVDKYWNFMGVCRRFAWKVIHKEC